VTGPEVSRVQPVESMTGPEHYRRAEYLLESAHEQLATVTHDVFDARLLAVQVSMATAQVHATLALAAAVGGLDAAEGPGGGSATGRVYADGAAWLSIVDKGPLLPPGGEG